MRHFFNVWHVVGGLALLGAWAMVLGWRWRRINDHPWCRRCRFDLSGSPALPAMCPECGTNLTRPRAVVQGQRGRQPLLLALGAVLLLLSTWMAGSTIYRRMLPIDWKAYAPAWWLVGDLKSGDGEQVEAALGELVKREGKGHLSSKHRGVLIDHIFESIIPGLQKTQVEWAAGVERAWRAGELSEARQLTFAKYAATFTLSLTPRRGVHQYECLEMQLEPQSPLRGRLEKPLVYRTRLTTVEFAGTPYDLFPLRQTALVTGGGYGWGGEPPSIAVLVEPGDHNLHTIWDIEARVDGHPETTLHWRQVQDVTVTVSPPGEGAMRFLTDDETARRIREAMHIRVVGLRRMAPDDDQIDVIGTVALDLPDVDVSLVIEVRDGDRFIGEAGGGTGLDLPFYFRLPAGRELESVDFIVRPSITQRGMPPPGGPPMDERPVWAGLPFTIQGVPIPWFDSLESDGLDLTLRERFRGSIARCIESWAERSENLRDEWP